MIDGSEASEQQQKSTSSVKRTSAFGLVERISYIGVQLAFVPICLNYLGIESFGFWVALTAISAYFSFADFGLGLGAMNAIAAENGRGGATQIARLVSSALALQFAIGLLMVAVSFAVVPLVAWKPLLGLSPQLSSHSVIAAVPNEH